MKLLPSSDELVPWDAGVDSSVPVPATHDDGTMIHVTALENLFAGIKPILWKFPFLKRTNYTVDEIMSWTLKLFAWVETFLGGVLKITYTEGISKIIGTFMRFVSLLL